ncbi:MAG TPA: ABC transporter permease [Myxococcales bacterium]
MSSALDTKLWRDLWRMRGQAVSIGLLTACAVSVYVASTSTYHALQRTQRAYYERYRFAEVFADLRRAPEQLGQDVRELPGVSQVQTGVAADVSMQVPGLADPATARLVGVDFARPGLNLLHLRSGRAPQPASTDEVLVSEGFFQVNRLALGASLTVVVNGRLQALRVVGVALSPEYVFAIRPGELMPDDRRYAILWMDRAALASATDLAGAFNQVSLTLSPGASLPEVQARLDRLLAPYGGQPSYPRERHTSHRFVSDEIRQLKAMALVIPAIFLGVAAFLLGVVFSRLVATQRQQIGTLKALGYEDRTIALHYLELASLVTLAGSALGVGAGFWMGAQLAQVYLRYYRFPELVYEPQASVAVQAALLGVAAALLGAGAAVVRAMRLPPAAAMMPEPPPTYRASLLERIGLGRLLGESGRMVLRSLSRRPMRAALSALGIAAAVAILVAGFFFNDSLDALLELTFVRAQREDLTVVFTTPLTADAVLQLSRQPGVVSTEGFRAVPVTLSRGHRSWRTALMGLSPDASLHRIVASSGRAVAPPPAGVLLSARLAQLLDVRPGEQVLAEVLEGRRPALPLTVSATVDDPVGVNAYLAAPALGDLLGEGRLFSGAFLSVDSAAEADLFRRLRAMPKVAGVTQQRLALASFQEFSAQMVLLMAGVLVAFAAAIAVGIVYSSGRIALAERERELATLRVLGFTRAEAWRVLAGEILVHLALGIPAGFLFGFGLALASVAVFDSDLFRLPLVVSPSTWALSALVVAGAAAGVLYAIFRWLGQLDLVAALKARE